MELMFAEDACAVTISREHMHGACSGGSPAGNITVETHGRHSENQADGSWRRLEQADVATIQTGSGTIHTVNKFKYLGAVVTRNGGIERDVSEKISRASRALGALHKAVFREKDLSMTTKQLVYVSVVLETLLYGSKIQTWARKRRTTKKLESFHNRCMKSILGITIEEQMRDNNYTSEMEGLIAKHRLLWLGHVAG